MMNERTHYLLDSIAEAHREAYTQQQGEAAMRALEGFNISTAQQAQAKIRSLKRSISVLNKKNIKRVELQAQVDLIQNSQEIIEYLWAQKEKQNGSCS